MSDRRRARDGEPRDREPPGKEAAFDIAARYLATRPRSRWEVERRLRRAGADEATTAATLTRLEGLGFVDDRAFARWWVEQRDRHAPRGQRMIDAELRQHGVPPDVIALVRDERPAPTIPDEPVPATEEERAAAALRAHLRGRGLPVDDRRAMQRIGMFLVRRGFSPAVARAALRASGADPGEDGEA